MYTVCLRCSDKMVGVLARTLGRCERIPHGPSYATGRNRPASSFASPHTPAIRRVSPGRTVALKCRLISNLTARAFQPRFRRVGCRTGLSGSRMKFSGRSRLATEMSSSIASQ